MLWFIKIARSQLFWDNPVLASVGKSVADQEDQERWGIACQSYAENSK